MVSHVLFPHLLAYFLGDPGGRHERSRDVEEHLPGHQSLGPFATIQRPRLHSPDDPLDGRGTVVSECNNLVGRRSHAIEFKPQGDTRRLQGHELGAGYVHDRGAYT